MTFSNRAEAAERVARPRTRQAKMPRVPRDTPRHPAPGALMSHRSVGHRGEAPCEGSVVSGVNEHAALGARSARMADALRRQENWVQLVKFGVVGASGYVVNLAVYTLLLDQADLHYVAAATGSFLFAASWNYWWNRIWTFRAQRGSVGIQGLRFLLVSAAVYGANVCVLATLISAGVGKIVAQALSIVLVTPLNYLGNKLWSFRH